ncbi:hypothetical protein CNMCM5793_007050 [Aspergillus hiratsukae]|uniref:Endochitinase B1 n=1 Tax=Aspergillus hiratsukae TaxID=1194566 RepID=A0A8H6UJQ4_9EURO|nr:hypothetical protein CNMCM5793_007050 [Aspergillus hiratsukae]KAF7157378.1 hypothetical protein CNMCM6106_002961 [Aspergillus hiratsukae]
MAATEHSSEVSMEGGYKSIAYFVDWAIYQRNYHPFDLPADKLTHVLFAFADVRPDSGEVFLRDAFADFDKHYPGDTWTEPGNNVYGCIKQLFLLKKQNRKLKVLLSIGGWTLSANLTQGTSTDAGRNTFAQSAAKMVLDYGFDGIDIDWEYPQNEIEAQGYVSLLQKCREALDGAAGPNRRFLLTIACPAGPNNYSKLKLREMTPFLDFYNLMSYDYAGSWDTIAGHQANLFPSGGNPSSTPFSTIQAINYYTQVGGVPPSKIVLGMPLYGRDFLSTNGPGTPYSGNGAGSWERGVWDYKALPQPGATESFDPQAGASWSYDPATRAMVSYDTVAAAEMKVDFIKMHGLGGGMWWEASGDKGGKAANKADGSLIGTFVEGIGGVNALEQRENNLDYHESRFDNLRAGFP